MGRMAARLLRGRSGGRGLPRYAYWEFRGQSWGEAAWSVLHRSPIRTFAIPERARRVLNLWGPNGWFPGQRR